MRWRVACVVVLLSGCKPDASAFGDAGSTTEMSDPGTSDGGVATGPTTGGGAEASSGGPLETGDTTGDTTGSSAADTGSSSGTGDDVLVLSCRERDLAACYDFAGVGEGMLSDRSGNGNDAVAEAVGVVPGPFGEAATFGPDSRIAVPDSASLDVPGPLTIEAWVLVDALPSAERSGVLDKEGQYSLMVYGNDQYRCQLTTGELFAGPVTVGEWSHVACTYDGAVMRLYVNGSEIGMLGASGSVNTEGVDPMSIGDSSPLFDEPLDGAIGGLRVWSRALDAAEVCDAAGDACRG